MHRHGVCGVLFPQASLRHFPLLFCWNQATQFCILPGCAILGKLMKFPVSQASWLKKVIGPASEGSCGS